MLDQGELFTIPNPCRGVCTSNNKGYCKGCLRSRKERFHWHDFTPFQQQIVINLCERRRQKIMAGPTEDVIEDETNLSQLDLFAEPIAENAVSIETKTDASVETPDSELENTSDLEGTSEPVKRPNSEPPKDQFDLF
ncbi:MAG: hypothetical protein CSH37_11420 [Thalassolituus sp.]|nr:MAG: hypothetical protein CSH37_11420 [Thalassolituus sp.]